MRELPIIFSGPMIRAILDDRKSQTRRVVKPQPTYIESSGRWHWPIPIRKIQKGCCTSVVTASREWWEYLLPEQMPYQLGDLLYVREAIRAVELDAGLDCIEYQADKKMVAISNTPEAADQWWKLYHHRGKKGAVVPSIFMPKEYARIWLEVTGVRVERVQEISVEDCIAEGLSTKYREYDAYVDLNVQFKNLWDSINGKKPGCSWEDNAWVWVIEFRRVKP